MRKEIAINDNWLFRQGFDAQCLESEFDWSDFFIASLPHNNVLQDESHFDERTSRCVCTYSRVLTVPEAYNGSRLVLRFEGVLSYAEVYVNGIFVASHRGEAPFEADITAPIRYDYENRLVVKVDSSLRKEVPSAGLRGADILYGGIFRDVVFRILDGRDIRDTYVYTPLVSDKACVVEAAVTLYDYYPDTTLWAEILDEDGKSIAVLPEKTVQGVKTLLRGNAEGVTLWSVETPAVYTLRVTLKSQDKVLDVRDTVFGFVSALFRRDGFYLNGKQTKLIGLCRYDSYPHLGRAMPAMQQRQDARLLRYELGCNVVRTMGAASVDFIDECARIGLMVIEDIGGDGYVGGADWRDALVETVEAVVRRDRSSPCVIAWGTRVNNSPDCDELYFKTNKVAHETDPSRCTLGSRDFLASRVFEDVFGYNDGSSAEKLRKFGGKKLFVPYMITEHTGSGLPTRSGDRAARRLQQSLRHLQVIDAALGSGRTAGALGLSLSDCSANTGLGGGDSLHHFGVTDAFRNYKTAAFAYAALGETPVLEAAGSLAPEEFTGALYVFTSCDSVRLYRGENLVGEFFPARRQFPNLPHPPVVIDDFVGTLPEADGITGLKRKLFNHLLSRAKGGTLTHLGRMGRVLSALLRRLLGTDVQGLQKLADKYAVSPSGGGAYTLEGITDGEVRLTRFLGFPVQKTLRVECDCDGHLHCEKSFEVVRFSVFCEDGRGNRLYTDFSPVTIRVTGAVALVGPDRITLQGGAGGFYVRSLTPGAGRVTVSAAYGEKTFDLEAEYGTMERL